MNTNTINMSLITINDAISYIEASDDPLSADVGIVKTDGGVWLYDVGNGERALRPDGQLSCRPVAFPCGPHRKH